MEVRASSKFDKRSLNAFYYAALYKKTKPLTGLVLRLALVSVGAVMWTVARLLSGSLTTLLFCVFYALALALFVFLYNHFALPAIRLKRYSKLIGAENRYVFRDDAMTVSTVSPGLSGESSIDYGNFVRVIETSEFFFIFLPNRQGFIVDKSTVEGGSFLDIREALASRLPEKKYVLCNY
ncbi:MAG: YcxB family protein [Clostridia bacterium]|nr:YcxB family protein [Clostridia bacterium]